MKDFTMPFMMFLAGFTIGRMTACPRVFEAATKGCPLSLQQKHSDGTTYCEIPLGEKK